MTQQKAGGFQKRRCYGFHIKCHSMFLPEKKHLMLPRDAMNWIQDQLHRNFFKWFRCLAMLNNFALVLGLYFDFVLETVL
jgi:hypothetical protein